MANTVIITALKGGVGKSTVAAGISAALSSSGKKVLALDLDFTVRSLELILGLESKTVFNLLDVIEERCSLERALVTHESLPGLYFLAAPKLSETNVSKLDFHKLFDEIKNFSVNGGKFDYVIADAQANDNAVIREIAAECDAALVLTAHSPSSVRAAELAGELLKDCGVTDTKLIVNGFDAEGVSRFGRTGIIEMIDSSRLMLHGVVPYDRELELAGEKGKIINTLSKSSNTRKAFMNIAARLDGEQTPLFDGFAGGIYKKLLQGKKS